MNLSSFDTFSAQKIVSLSTLACIKKPWSTLFSILKIKQIIRFHTANAQIVQLFLTSLHIDTSVCEKINVFWTFYEIKKKRMCAVKHDKTATYRIDDMIITNAFSNRISSVIRFRFVQVLSKKDRIHYKIWWTYFHIYPVINH